MSQKPPENRKLYQQIATAMAAAIAEGRFGIGEKLPPERELAEEFKVSRPTVREAMLALELRGLVEARHGSGIYVLENAASSGVGIELDIGAFELTEARALFEGEAAALAATTITDDDLAKLEVILAEMIQENRGPSANEAADRRFHIAIAEATRNCAIIAVVQALWDMRDGSPLCQHMLKRAREVGVQPKIDDHRILIDTLRARDPQAARRAMRNHLERVTEGLLLATEIEAVERAREGVALKRQDFERRRAI